MSSQSSHLLQSWILPHCYLIIRIPMSTNYLLGVPTEHQIAHLGPSIYTVQQGAIKRIPKFDCLVRRSSTTCQHTMIMWTPSDTFNRCRMTAKFANRCSTMCRPYKQLVIITTRCKQIVTHRPLQPAHLLTVTLVFTDYSISLAKVAHLDGSVT